MCPIIAFAIDNKVCFVSLNIVAPDNQRTLIVVFKKCHLNAMALYNHKIHC